MKGTHKSVRIGTFLCAGLFIVVPVYLLFSLSILLFVNANSYASLLGWYARWRPDAFDVGAMSSSCMTFEWYTWLTVYRVPLMTGILAVLVVYLWYSKRVWAFLRVLRGETGRIVRFMAASYRQNSRREKAWLWGLFSAILAYRLYMCLVIPFHPDELCSYLYFARQGFLVTLTSYPMPNNHVLYNLICACLSKLTWLSPKLVMRLPPVAGDLLLQYGIFCLFRRWGGFRRGIIVVVGVAFCYMISFYATRGRGYQLQEICALVSGLAAWTCFCGEGRGERKMYATFVFFSVAGIYINPTFFYHFTAVILMVLYFALKRKASPSRLREALWRSKAASLWRPKEPGALLALGRAVLLVAALTVVLYLPVILASKMGGMQEEVKGRAGFGWMVSDFHSLAYDFRSIGYYGRPGILGVGVLAILFVWLYGKKRLAGGFYDNSVVYLVCVGLSLAFWSLQARDYPLERTLCWLALALYILFINACFDLWKRVFPRMRPWVFGCFLLVHAAGSLRGLYWEPSSWRGLTQARNYGELEPDLEQLAALRPLTWQITKSDDFYPMYLRLYLAERGDKARVLWEKEKVVGDVVFLPALYGASIMNDGYVLWGKRRLTVEGNEMDIYVAKRLLSQKTF
jgi:hypothetical protein